MPSVCALPAVVGNPTPGAHESFCSERCSEALYMLVLNTVRLLALHGDHAHISTTCPVRSHASRAMQATSGTKSDDTDRGAITPRA